MFHLFANIIMYPDIASATLKRHKIMITECADIDSRLTREDIMRISDPMEQYHNIDELLQSYGDDVSFFDHLYQLKESKPWVMCDKPSFAQIAAKVMKICYSSINSKIAYMMYAFSYRYFCALRVYNSVTAHEVWPTLTKQEMIDVCTPYTLEQFTELWNQVTVTGDVGGFRSKISREISTEMKIVKHYAGDLSFDQDIIDSFKQTINDAVLNFAHTIDYANAIGQLSISLEDIKVDVPIFGSIEEELQWARDVIMNSSESAYISPILEVATFVDVDDFVSKIQSIGPSLMLETLSERFDKINPIVLMYVIRNIEYCKYNV